MAFPILKASKENNYEKNKLAVQLILDEKLYSKESVSITRDATKKEKK